MPSSVDLSVVRKIVAYVAVLPTERATGLSLQNAAVCWMWLESPEASEDDATAATIKDRILTWLAGPRPKDHPTEGRRHQPLLRDLVEKIRRDGVAALRRDEIDLLCVAAELINMVDDPSDLARYRDLILRDIATLQDRRWSLPFVPGWPSLNTRITVVSESDILSAPVTASRLLAGIELPTRGPVLECCEDTLILGDVPDSCTVIVSDGNCWLEGYLLGRALVRDNCEIRDNVAGVAIVLRGSVRARSIINNAYIVTKSGDIVCRNTQSPRLLFSARSIRIAENAMLGKYVARDIEIGGEVQDGEFHITDSLKAPLFRHSGAGRLSIVMREELRCEDYGEVTSTQLNRLISEAYRLKQSARNLRTIATLNENEAEQQAEAALRYLFSTLENEKTIEDAEQLQRRLDTVRRLMVNLETVLDKAQQEVFSRSRRMPALRTEPDSDDGAAAVSPPGYELHKDFAEQDALVRQYRLALVSKSVSRTQTDLIIAEIQEKLSLLAKERETLEQNITVLRKSAAFSPQYLGGANVRDDATKTGIFLEVLPGLYRNPPPSLVSRLESPLVQRALRTVASCLKHSKQCRERADANESNFRTASARLGEEFQIRLPEEIAKPAGRARIEGKFEFGVRVFASLGDFEAGTPRPGGVLIVTRGSDTTRVITYPQGGSFPSGMPAGQES